MINSREFVPRGHLRLIGSGGSDASQSWQDTPHTTVTASVPESFLAVCRCHTAISCVVEVRGMKVTVISSRRVTNGPGADLVAWETFRQAVLAATSEARSDIGRGHHSLPPQITAAYWRTLDGRHLRVTADRVPHGWAAHWFSRTGGDAAG